jgi:hypothetical protein
MKKLINVILVLWSVNTIAQSDQGWQFGLQWGAHGNRSVWSGGMEQANAKFSSEKAGGGAFGLAARYDINRHWMISTAFGLQSLGFQFSLAQNYSLLNPQSRLNGVKPEFGMLEVPVLVNYKFNPNCRNARWVVGAGLVQDLMGAHRIDMSYTPGSEMAANGDYLKTEVNVVGGIHRQLRFSIAREKVFSRGGILSAALIFNAGLSRMATARVDYRVDGNTYYHYFSTRGNYVGLRITYYFRAFWGKK